MSSLEKHGTSAPAETDKKSDWAADNTSALWTGQEKSLAKLASSVETRDNDPQATLDKGLSTTANLYDKKDSNAAASDEQWAKRAAMTPSQRLENELDQQPTAVEIEKVTPKVIQADLKKTDEGETKSNQSGFRAMGVRILPPPNRPEAPKANTI